jgi:RNA polymerase sigma-70 factor (ECF subfamily)
MPIKTKKTRIKKLIIPIIGKMNKVAMYLCRDKDKAEDLVAETFLKVCENIHRLKDKTKFRAWVFRILNNTFISNYRAQKNIKFITIDADLSKRSTTSAHIDSNTLNIWGSNPERYLINKLRDEEIRKNINLLPEDYRMAIVLCDIENLSYKEISEIMGIPIGTVRSRISRGRAILQKKLQNLALEMGIIKEKKQSKEEICNCK